MQRRSLIRRHDDRSPPHGLALLPGIVALHPAIDVRRRPWHRPIRTTGESSSCASCSGEANTKQPVRDSKLSITKAPSISDPPNNTSPKSQPSGEINALTPEMFVMCNLYSITTNQAAITRCFAWSIAMSATCRRCRACFRIIRRR